MLANRGLSAALTTAGVLGPQAADELPAPDAFDVIVHWTCKTLAEWVTSVAEALHELQGAGVVSPEELIGALRAHPRGGRRRRLDRSPRAVFIVLAAAF